MNKIKIISLCILFVSIIVGGWLRFENHTQVPLPGQSLDEYSNSWVGISLINVGVPIGISDSDSYDDVYLEYINVDRIYQSASANGQPIYLRKPWFDHPPSLGLLTGGFAYLNGARVFEDAGARLIRKPMIILGIIAIALIFWLGWIEFSPLTGALASLVYAVSPYSVIGNRMVQAENGFTPLFIFTLILLIYFMKLNRRWLLWLAAAIAGVALLFKLSAISVVIAGIFILMTQKKSLDKKIQETFIFGLVSISFLTIFAVYGLAIDQNTFMKVLLWNGQRRYSIGFNALFDLITTNRITTNKFLTDGWALAGWLSLLYVANKRKGLVIIMAILSYMGVYLLFGSEPYGWYRFPFLPFLALSVGELLKEWIETNKQSLVKLIIIMIPIGVCLSKLVNIEASWITTVWRVSFLALTVFFGLSEFIINSKTKYFRTGIIILLILFAIILSCRYGLLINIDYWYHVS